MGNLALEIILAASENKELSKKYFGLVSELETKIYSRIDLSLAQDNGIYTKHNKEHFDKVVEIAGLLISNNGNNFLNDGELFLLLCSIRVHDIGNIMSRKAHENTIISVIKDFNISHSLTVHELNCIKDIAKTHSGISKKWRQRHNIRSRNRNKI